MVEKAVKPEVKADSKAFFNRNQFNRNQVFQWRPFFNRNIDSDGNLFFNRFFDIDIDNFNFDRD